MEISMRSRVATFPKIASFSKDIGIPNAKLKTSRNARVDDLFLIWKFLFSRLSWHACDVKVVMLDKFTRFATFACHHDCKKVNSGPSSLAAH